MVDLKPIETAYAGHRFRSRLEARWAVAFDAMGVTWHYEREAFSLPGGTGYLPDFYLPELRLWVEVKASGGDATKLDIFARGLVGTGERATVLREIPDEAGRDWYWAGEEPRVWLTISDNPDLIDNGPIRFCVCERCGKVGFTFQGRPRRIGCCKIAGHDRDGRGGRHPLILAAFYLARAMRFEPGAHANTNTFRRAGDVLRGI